MKTAVSLPDELFASADAFAKRTGRSRSQVYADALFEYLVRHDEDSVTARLDELASEVDTTLPPFAADAVRRLLATDEW